MQGRLNPFPSLNSTQWLHTGYFLILIFIFFLIFPYQLYFNPAIFLPRDNASLHFPTFQAVAGHLRYLGAFPEWLYPAGAPLPLLANNALVIAPYKWIGYALAQFTDLPLNLLYKFSVLVCGQGFFLTGLFLLLKQRFGSFAVASGGTLLAASSGICLIFLHQEQALGTLLYLPWLHWCWHKSQRHSRWIYVAAATAGLAMHNHYPQLYLIYFFLLAVVYRPWTRVKKGTCLAALILFLATAAPVLYSYLTYHQKIASPFRGQSNSVDAPTYSQYEQMNRLQLASVPPRALLDSLRGKTEPSVHLADIDAHIFVWCGASLLVILFSLVKGGRPERQSVALIALLAIAAMGIHGPAAKFFWYWLPGIKMFRQYYYLLTFFQFHLLLLTLGATIRWAKYSEKISYSPSRYLVFAVSLWFANFLGMITAPVALVTLGVVSLGLVFARRRGPAIFTLASLALLIVATAFDGRLVSKRVWQRSVETNHLNAPPTNAAAFEHEQLWGYRINPMVSRKGSLMEYHLRSNLQAHAFLSGSVSAQLPISAQGITGRLQQHGVRFQVSGAPLGSVALVLPWFADERWSFFADAGHLPSASITSGAAVLEGTLSPSPWLPLVGFSWAVAALVLLWVLLPLGTLLAQGKSDALDAASHPPLA